MSEVPRKKGRSHAGVAARSRFFRCRSHGSAGYTLIEILVALVLFVILLLAAIPFTQSWISSQRQLQGRAVLMNAIGVAKGFALRNPENKIARDSVVILRLIRSADADAPVVVTVTQQDDAQTLIWQGEMHPDNTVT